MHDIACTKQTQVMDVKIVIKRCLTYKIFTINAKLNIWVVADRRACIYLLCSKTFYKFIKDTHCMQYEMVYAQCNKSCKIMA